ncbi:MAG: MmcQ/YjbR family DNA-binding protein [Bacteroidia bacterium]
MTAEEIREYCIQKPGVEESFPFDNKTLVFKVGGKMFLLLSLDSIPLSFNVKCEPGKALELREKYSSVLPGYHMNKRHWNTVLCEGTVAKKMLLSWIDDSYELVYFSLPKKIKETVYFLKKDER